MLIEISQFQDSLVGHNSKYLKNTAQGNGGSQGLSSA